MIAGLLDHLFVLFVFVLAFPLGGWWAYRRFLARLAREGGAALVREYRITIVWLVCLGAASFAIWLGGGRDLAALGLAAPREGPASGLIFGIAGGALDRAGAAPARRRVQRQGRRPACAGRWPSSKPSCPRPASSSPGA